MPSLSRSAGFARSPVLLVSVLLAALIVTSAAPADAARGRVPARKLATAKAIRAQHEGMLSRTRGDSRSEQLQSALHAAGVEAERSTEVAAFEGYVETYTYPGGDLNADGSPDVIVDRYMYDYETDEETTSSEALSGVDGQTIWTMEPEGFGFTIPAGALDDTPGDDVLVLGAAEPQYVADIHTYTVFVEGRRGTDAASLWRSETEHRGLWLDGGALYAEIETEYPDVTGIADFDGDGSNDVLTSAWAYTFACVLDCIQDVTSSVESISGADGEALATYKSGAGEFFGYGMPDLDGDGADDVMVFGYDDALYVEAYGGSGDELWTKTLPDAFDAYVWSADLDGDGVGELIAEIMVDDEDGSWATRTERWTGDGDVVWTRSRPGEWYSEVAGDATSDGTADLLATDYSAYWGEGDDFPAALADGADGTSIWEQVFSYVTSAGDLDGDGVVDLEDITFEYDEETDDENYDYAYLSGADLTALWAREDLRSSYLWGRGDDLNGDGADDVYLIRETGGFQYQALSGLDGIPMWTSAVSGDGYLYGFDALDTSDGVLLIETSVSADESSDRVAARRGPDGSLKWSRSSAGS